MARRGLQARAAEWDATYRYENRWQRKVATFVRTGGTALRRRMVALHAAARLALENHVLHRREQQGKAVALRRVNTWLNIAPTQSVRNLQVLSDASDENGSTARSSIASMSIAGTARSTDSVGGGAARVGAGAGAGAAVLS
jgi:hypothetical protein